MLANFLEVHNFSFMYLLTIKAPATSISKEFSM